MISSQLQHPSCDPHHSRWQSLSTQEKIQEFRELVNSPFWLTLPNELKTRIQSLLNNTPPALRR